MCQNTQSSILITFFDHRFVSRPKSSGSANGEPFRYRKAIHSC